VSLRLPRWILFDLDGTLLDSLPGIESSVRAAFTACRLPQLHTNLRAMIGPPIRSILSRSGEIEDQNILDCLEREFRADYDTLGWRKTVCFPHTGHVLRLMRERGYRLLAISNKPRHISLQILENEQILQFFEEIVTRDSRSPAYAGKEEMVEAIQADRHISSTDCLIVGDTIEDAKAAASAGIRFAFMSHGYGTVDATSSVPVTWRLDSMSEFLPLLETCND
jgi:phosphoglycolate phosphatase